MELSSSSVYRMFSSLSSEKLTSENDTLIFSQWVGMFDFQKKFATLSALVKTLSCKIIHVLVLMS